MPGRDLAAMNAAQTAELDSAVHNKASGGSINQ